MRKITIILILILAILTLRFVYVYADEIPIEAVNCGIRNGGTYQVETTTYNAIFYATQGEAVTVGESYAGNECADGVNWTWYTGGSAGYVVDPAIWLLAGANYCGGDSPIMNMRVYPSGTLCPGDEPPYNDPLTDTDQDGLPDECDPYPNDPGGTIDIYAYQGEDVQSSTWIAAQKTDGEMIAMGEYQEYPEAMNILSTRLSVDNGWIQDHGFCGTYEGGTTNDDPADLGGGIEIPPDDNPSDLPAGEDNTGNVSETDYLADIVTNTQNINNNQQDISDKLHQLHVDNVNETIADVEGETAAEQETQEQIGDLEGIENDYDGEFTEGDKPEENLIEDILDGFVDNNPLQQVIDDTGIDTTNSYCSFNWDYKGTNVVFSICEYQSQLQVMGSILLALVALTSLVMIMRK